MATEKAENAADEQEDEEEEEDEEGELKEGADKKLVLAEKNSVFKYKLNGAEQEGCYMLKRDVDLKLWRVTSGSQFREWCGLHLREKGARAEAYLKELAVAQSVTMPAACKKKATLIEKIAESYDLTEQQL
jgi:hypothetical protein